MGPWMLKIIELHCTSPLIAIPADGKTTSKLLGYVIQCCSPCTPRSAEEEWQVGEPQSYPAPATHRHITGELSPSKAHVHKHRGAQTQWQEEEAKLQTQVNGHSVWAPSRAFPGEHQSQYPSVKSIKMSQQKQLYRASFRLLPRGYRAHYKMQRKSILRLHKVYCGLSEEGWFGEE